MRLLDTSTGSIDVRQKALQPLSTPRPIPLLRLLRHHRPIRAERHRLPVVIVYEVVGAALDQVDVLFEGSAEVGV